MVVEYQKTVKRTLWVAQCNCDQQDPWRVIFAENAPREKMCPKCGTWVAIREETATSPEYKMLNEQEGKINAR
jgi:hypothetical protein